MKENLIARSLFTLAICLVIGSWFISNGLKEGNRIIAEQLSDGIEATKSYTIDATQGQLLTATQLSEYLGISNEQVTQLFPDSNGKSVIPYLKIKGELFFPKAAIDKWLHEIEATSINR
ncbi:MULTISPECIES: helix-turn-helix domain-containing protein [Bacillaceae]|uniref:helix-turn-helix domain-containing protein n=1 Tax=Bacillaceae TaxID=186817 RepID=UPI002A0F0EEA|nr:helix-turn-helix domain-containing protein [Cytobacillus sp. IB215316]MDX8362155.1 helix-turn-helix domain-containing protein [Cytobacillus sp. IB215316]